MTKRSLDVQKIFLSSQEVFSKKFQKIENFFQLNFFYTGFTHSRWRRVILFFGGGQSTKSGSRGKIEKFYKVRDIDTMMKPGYEEHQADDSAVLKQFSKHR